MNPFNLREAINAISEVIINRPKPIREFDQIYMRAGDMLLQTEHVSHLFKDKSIVFIGDGDSICLCLAYLHKIGILKHGPSKIHILDFDERIVLSIKHFAKKFEIENVISSELYNVASALPKEHWQKFDGFYTNPPYGASNNGKSVECFLKRGIEACKGDCVASVVIADDGDSQWTRNVLFNTQTYMLSNFYFLSQQIPAFHSYHLDDAPDLKSCALSFKRVGGKHEPYSSIALEKESLQSFYGTNKPLTIKFVKDLTEGGTKNSQDHQFIPYE